MSVSRAVVSWNDFSAGHQGATAPWKLPPNGWLGSNMVAYRDGTVGPRAGVWDVGATGVPEGRVLGLGYEPHVGRTLWFIVGSTVYHADFEAPGVAVGAIGSLATTPTVIVPSVRVGSETYIAVWGDKCYRINTDTGSEAVQALSGSPDGFCIAEDNGRLLVGGTQANPSRIYFSDFNNFHSWPALNWISVGDGNWAVRTIQRTGSHLTVTKQDGSVWAITGSSPENWTVRRVAGTGPVWPHHSAVVNGNQLLYRPFSGTGQHAPFMFRAGLPRPVEDFRDMLRGQWHHIHPGTSLALGTNEQISVTALSYDGEAVCLDGTNRRALVFRHGVWAVYDFSQLPQLHGGLVAFDPNSGWLGLTDGGGDGQAARFFAWNPSGFDRPVISSDFRAQAGDATATPMAASLTLPEYVDPKGRDVVVREVIVDLDSLETQTVGGARLTARVRATGQLVQLDNDVPVVSGDWEDTVSTAGGFRARRVRIPVASPPSSAFQVELTGVAGVKVRRVSALLEVADRSVRGA